jgi:hypothetical protein
LASFPFVARLFTTSLPAILLRSAPLGIEKTSHKACLAALFRRAPPLRAAVFF